MSRAGIAAAARAMKGTPFVHGGRLPGKAIDCSGVLVCSTREAGYDVVDAKYGNGPNLDLMIQFLEKNGCARVTEPQNGDFPVYNFGGGWGHVGVYDDGYVVHACDSSGAARPRVMRIRYEGFWASPFAIYRFPEVE